MHLGWEAICDALDVSRWTAMRYAAREHDPLPVGRVRGRPAIYIDALESWAQRQIQEPQAA